MAAWESWIRRYSGHTASDRETVLFYHVKQSISYGPFGRPIWPVLEGVNPDWLVTVATLNNKSAKALVSEALLIARTYVQVVR